MTMMRHILAGAAALALTTAATLSAFAEDAVLKLATQLSGTVNWEIDTIKHHGFDTANGVRLEVVDVAAGPAAQVAFQGGEVHAIVSDWLWVAMQRAAGQDFVFIPYSKAVGALMVPGDSSAASIADLKGGKIGIAGGPVDKSWLILRAFTKQEHGFDIAAESEQVFGAPPLIFKAALDGEVDGAVNFWHFGAKMQAAGMKPLITVADAAAKLGLDPETPLLGYVVRGEMVRDNPEIVDGLMKASRAAKDLLASDDAAWERLKPLMKADNDAQFDALKAGFRAGIPADAPVSRQAAEKMFALMAELGGAELLGDVKALPDGVFVQPGS
ncbi:MAG: ABC transporter substrate-binding protein [Rhizobiaceae bacterium]|jgi:NitT/TauT family transport system substrate-binding protein|nr:ABC transporter substrate-binding protein [Rhizobiaceae bacterium]